MWPFGSEESDFPDRYGMTDIDLSPDVRHVDVAILWGLGQKNRAHEVARELTGRNIVHVESVRGIETEQNLRRIRDKFKEGRNDD